MFFTAAGFRQTNHPGKCEVPQTANHRGSHPEPPIIRSSAVTEAMLHPSPKNPPPVGPLHPREAWTRRLLATPPPDSEYRPCACFLGPSNASLPPCATPILSHPPQQSSRRPQAGDFAALQPRSLRLQAGTPNRHTPRYAHRSQGNSPRLATGTAETSPARRPAPSSPTRFKAASSTSCKPGAGTPSAFW